MPDIGRRIINRLLQFKNQILWAIVFILAVNFIYFVIINSDRPSHGFATYYTASRLLLEGEKVKSFYNDDWFSSKVENYVPAVYEIYHVNLPTTSLIMLPLAKFDYTTSRIIWTIFNFFILIFSAGVVIRKFHFQEKWIPITLILLFSFQPLYANFSYAQIYVVIFCLLILTWYAYNSGKDELLGFLIGFILIIKTASIFLLILLLVQKKWRSLGWVFATAFLLILLSIPFVGIEAWLAYADALTKYVSNPTLSVTAYQTIHSFFYHLTVFDQQWNPSPVIYLPMLGKLLTIFLSLIILAVTSYYAFKLKKSDLSFGAFLIAGVVLSPASLDYHYIILLIPIFILIKEVRERKSVIFWISIIFVYSLIAAALPYTSPKVTAGWWALLAYPKLYGALGLFGLFIWISFDSVFKPKDISISSK